MANPDFFKPEFDKHSTNGVIGDSDGNPAYGYVRVSSKGQSEEGRSGLPRQIESIHTKAKQMGYRISWDMLYADDSTGFEFQERKQLQRMLKDIQKNRQADTLFIENIDRLSRNADWHQGFLLEQFKNLGVNVVAYKDIGTRILRSVQGAIAQDGFESTSERLTQGRKKKLESGRITAKQPAYGFRFVDSHGNPNGKISHDTHYEIYEPEAKVIRIIFDMIANGSSLKRVCEALEGVYPPVKNAKCWEPVQVSNIIKSRLYKGEYIGNRYLFVKELGKNGKKTVKKTKRPESEWIIVSIPRIVNEPLWKKANAMLAKNAQTAKRNGKGVFLLTGLVKCAVCGLTYTGSSKDGISYYRCSSYSRPKPIRDVLNCHQVMIQSAKLEEMIWKVILDFRSKPEEVEKHFKDRENENEATELNSQIKFLKAQLEACDIADRKIKDGYNAGVYSAEEAIEERDIVNKKRERFKVDLQGLEDRLSDYEDLEDQKEALLEVLKFLKKNNFNHKLFPSEINRDIFKRWIDTIVLDTNNRKIVINGNLPISGTYDEDFNIDYTFTRKGIINITWKAMIDMNCPEKTVINFCL